MLYNKLIINKKIPKKVKNKLVIKENILKFWVDFDRVDFERGWILIAGGF